MQTILHGKNFFLSDDHGDVRHGTEGYYAHDARYLSRWVLRVDGRRPQPLGPPQGPYYQRMFVQRNIQGSVLAPDSLIIERRYFVEDALYQRFTIENLTVDELSFVVTVETASDFHDIFQVKQDAFAKHGDDTGEVGMTGDTLHPSEPPHLVGMCARIGDGDTTTHIESSKQFDVDEDGCLRWHVTLAAKARWMCDLRIACEDRDTGIEFDAHRHSIDQEIAMWLAETPMLIGGSERLRTVYKVSVQDLAALRIHENGSAGGMVPAAGLPWFMTPFGRDTLITCFQSIALGPQRAQAAIRYLAARQAKTDDPLIDAEPGKILHEVREGEIAERGYAVYYGSIDSTPLFLILLDEIHRWTRDDAFVNEHKEHALAALEWIEKWGDIDGDGYLEYQQRSPQGLVNQSWKDSWDSQRFNDGRYAEVPIAPAEVQAYAYDARLRVARLARIVWNDTALADRLEADAAALKERFNRDFWIPSELVTPAGPDDPRRDGFFALALDAQKKPVDSLTSNIGHLLWCGIVNEDKVDAVVRQLHSRHLYNGWGIRTMSTLDVPYNPISYHNGTVWPHDTSLCVAGLVRVGSYDIAARIANAVFDAAMEFGGRLPEVFAGIDRSETGHAVLYPTTCSPQAWAAAAPILLLTTLVGLQPHPTRSILTLKHTSVPHWLDGMEWRGIRAFGRSWDVQVRHGIPIIERH